MQINKILSALNLIERIREVRENWFPWMVILISIAIYSISVVFATDAVVRHQVEATRLEQIGTAWLLFGALWTALGAHLNTKDRTTLDTMANQGVLDAKEIVIQLSVQDEPNYGMLPAIHNGWSTPWQGHVRWIRDW